MKVTIEKQALHTAAARTQGTITDRSMANIAINASQNNELVLSAHDPVITVYTNVPCQVDQEGLIFVPGKIFTDIVKELPEATVALISDDNFLYITVHDDSQFEMKIPLLKDLVWHEPKPIPSTNQATIPSAHLYYMIQQVQFCIEQDSPRNYGAVAFLHKPEADRLRLVGTDGFRLSYCDAQMQLPEEFLRSGVCISKRALVEMSKMCTQGYEEIRLAISEDEKTLLIETPHHHLYSRLSTVKYPNYRGVLPTANLIPVKLSRNKLAAVTKRVLLAADKTNALRLSFSHGSLTLRSRTVGSSESKESLPMDNYRGVDSELAINGKFLTDVFASMPGDEVTMQFKTELDPIVVIPKEEPKTCRSMHVLVPIRENN